MNLLLVEDDPQIVEALVMSLERLGHHVDHLSEATADLAARVAEADVVVLDVGLPGEDGFAICRNIRRWSSIPILMLTARSDDVDIVAGLEVGADEYVIKPVSPRVLDARIKALVRRQSSSAVADPPPADGAGSGVRIDRLAAEVTRDGVPLRLSPTEKRLLFVLADHPGQVLSREQLFELAWKQDFLGDSRLVDNAVLRLRGKLDDANGDSMIETVRGFGYRFRAAP
ncbi:response regulator [Nocardia brasiliensis]|uniref:Response regulator n=1 Tax=Nocardia brasiliensis TaxID=37326 RepID=A0A6G9XMZ3_NOCBR|nr:response regulator transcription factor [Nocardia brasiliensis]QIS02220.1 response regulator [Nocardia brasiliensis]